MKNNFPLLAFLGLLIVNSSQSRAQPKVGPKPTLTVSAAASMKDALNQINARFNAAVVRVNYGASGALQRQIENGAPVDVFIAAALNRALI
jgi:molybdate transport system substrate-binding protein